MLGLRLLACLRGDQFFYRATLLAEKQYSEATDEVFTEHRLRSISERTEPSNL